MFTESLEELSRPRYLLTKALPMREHPSSLGHFDILDQLFQTLH